MRGRMHFKSIAALALVIAAASCALDDDTPSSEGGTSAKDAGRPSCVEASTPASAEDAVGSPDDADEENDVGAATVGGLDFSPVAADAAAACGTVATRRQSLHFFFWGGKP